MKGGREKRVEGIYELLKPTQSTSHLFIFFATACGYTCHEGCYKKVHKKCEGKSRFKDIPEYQSPDVS